MPPLERRIECLRRLADAGIKTWVSMAPLIPGLMLIDLEETLGKLRGAGVSAVSPGLLRFQGYEESKDHFEKSTGRSSAGLLEGGEEIIGRARGLIREHGFEPIDQLLDWQPDSSLDEYAPPIS